jgi:hypothetical protein
LALFVVRFCVEQSVVSIMSHVRRFVFVPSETLSRIGTSPNYQQIHGDSVHAGAYNILARKDGVPDDIKFTQFAQEQQRYLDQKKVLDQPLKLSIESEDDGKNPAVLQTFVNAYERFPRLQTRLRQLADFVRTVQGLRWNRTGEIEIDGVLIPGSNIGALMHDIITPAASMNPTGQEQFASVLLRSNIPRNIMGSEVSEEEMESPFSASTPRRPRSTLPPDFHPTVPPPQPFLLPPSRAFNFSTPYDRNQPTPPPRRLSLQPFNPFMAPAEEEEYINYPQSPRPASSLSTWSPPPARDSRLSLFQDVAGISARSPGGYPLPSASTRSQHTLRGVDPSLLYSAASGALRNQSGRGGFKFLKW